MEAEQTRSAWQTSLTPQPNGYSRADGKTSFLYPIQSTARIYGFMIEIDWYSSSFPTLQLHNRSS